MTKRKPVASLELLMSLLGAELPPLKPAPKRMPRVTKKFCPIAPATERGAIEQMREGGWHWHKCGHVLHPEPGKPTEGCGFEWAHENDDRELANGSKHSHDCPQCGKGPWSWKFFRDMRRRAL
jgi:hypothetical protein